MALLREALRREPTLRSDVAAAVIEEPSLFASGARRAYLLRSVARSATEKPVIELALASLESPGLKNSTAAVTAAAKIVRCALQHAPSIAQMESRMETRLLGLAARYAPGGGDFAAAAALKLLPLTDVASMRAPEVVDLARGWFARRHSEKNPWLVVLDSAPSKAGLALLARIVTGRVPTVGRESLRQVFKRLEGAVNDLVLTTTIVTVATRQLCSYLALPKAISNAAVAALSTGFVLGARGLAAIRRGDQLNSDRDWERVEAVARLSSLRARLAKSEDPRARPLAARASALLDVTSRAQWQPWIVRVAAELALDGTISDPIDLWNAAASRSAGVYAERPARPDIEL